VLNKTTIQLSRQVTAARIKQIRHRKGLTPLQLARRIRQRHRRLFPLTIKQLVKTIGDVESGTKLIEPTAFTFIMLGLDEDPTAELEMLIRKWDGKAKAGGGRAKARQANAV
jgi:hypothetical protein